MDLKKLKKVKLHHGVPMLYIRTQVGNTWQTPGMYTVVISMKAILPAQ